MMFTFLFSKRWISAVSLCSLLALSLPSWATVVTTHPLPPPGYTTTKLVTTTTKVGGKWVTTTDPIGTGNFSLNFEYDPLRMMPDESVGPAGVTFLYPYYQLGDAPTIEYGTNPTGFIRNITGQLIGTTPVPNMFTITFIDLHPEFGAFQFRSFANNLPRTNPNASYMDILSDGVVTTRLWGEDGSISEGISYVPEPSLTVLFTMGLAGMSAYRATRCKKQAA